MSSPPSAGVPLGRYRLLSQLGRGGMAVVYRALMEGPEGFSRTVVIKRILPLFARDPQFIKMFVREARLSALLTHPAIAQVYELDCDGGEYFICMEYLEGISLQALLDLCAKAQEPLPPGVVCYLIAQVAEALAYAHALCGPDGRPLQIVHRDVSPSNIMLTHSGAVKLLDFGIARAAEEVTVETTRTGAMRGKFSYMSPEQADAEPLDGRSDIFALGVVMYEALLSRRLFRGESPLHTLKLVREAKVAPPSSLRPELDPEIDRVVLKMLARRPADRFAGGAEVHAALEPIVHRLHGGSAGLRRFLAELGPIAPAEAPVEADFEPTVTGGNTEGVSRGELEARPRPRARAGLALLLGLTLGGAVVGLTRPQPPATAPPTTAPSTTAPAAPAVTVAPSPATVRPRLKVKRRKYVPPPVGDEPDVVNPFGDLER